MPYTDSERQNYISKRPLNDVTRSKRVWVAIVSVATASTPPPPTRAAAKRVAYANVGPLRLYFFPFIQQPISGRVVSINTAATAKLFSSALPPLPAFGVNDWLVGLCSPLYSIYIGVYSHQITDNIGLSVVADQLKKITLWSCVTTDGQAFTK